MQAILLAAGKGSRLHPYTDSMPKPLVPVKGKSMLLRLLDQIVEVGMNDITIVTGYRAEQIEKTVGDSYSGVPIRYIRNVCYDKTNNIYSLYLARDVVTGDVLLTECDLCLKMEAIQALLKNEAPCSILTSPFNSETMDGTVVLSKDCSHADAMLLKKMQHPGEVYSDAYKTVNVYKFTRNFWHKKYIPLLEIYLDTQDKTSYYELPLGGLIYFQNDDIQIVNVPAECWKEVDDENDLKRAEKWFQLNDRACKQNESIYDRD